MTEKEYLTLKQISEEIKVNYKTLISCKHRLKNFVQGYAVGRTAKYDPELLDFFRMVFALLDEGYQTDEIIKLLNNGVTSDNDLFIKEWLDTWRDKLRLTDRNHSIISKEDEGMTDRLTDSPTDRLDDSPTDGLTDSPTDGLTDSLTDLPTDSLTDRLTD